MVRSPIHAIHQSLGAKFFSEFGREVPQEYGGSEEEYRSVRSSVGLADCSHWGKLILTGRDRAKFLQSLTSNEVAGLKEGEGSLNTILNPKGRMLAVFWVHVLSDSLFLETEPSEVEKLAELLEKYKFFSDVRMENATSEWGALLLAGPSAPDLVAALSGSRPKALPPAHFFGARVDGEPVRIANRPTTGLPEFAFYVRNEGVKTVWDRIMGAGFPFGIRPVGQAALETLRIEAGIPRYGIDIDDFIIPVEAGLEKYAISYTKGCYVGQEVIARIKTYGHVNKRLGGLWIEGKTIPPRESKIFDVEGKEVGWITSAALPPDSARVAALGYLRPQISRPGTEVRLEVGGERRKGEVRGLPFLREGDHVRSE
jgi:folate-binding protein YgfZ